jgi:penicillin-binding protein 1A
MNQMMQLVVTEGTGRRATLDFTHTAGKTGTSSSYRDAWFVGFTGGLVTGVWVGNDENRPMNRITGGSIPTLVWHGFMSAAHTSMDIPAIPGLPVHPTQVAERQRLAELKRTEGPAAAVAPARRHGVMPDQTREVLRKIAQALRVAAGADAAPAPTDRRADAGAAAVAVAPGRAAGPTAPAPKQP